MNSLHKAGPKERCRINSLLQTPIVSVGPRSVFNAFAPAVVAQVIITPKSEHISFQLIHHGIRRLVQQLIPGLAFFAQPRTPRASFFASD